MSDSQRGFVAEGVDILIALAPCAREVVSIERIAEAPAARMIVAAGPYRRRLCPARCAPPSAIRHPRLFREGQETPVACQLDPATGELWWMERRMAPGSASEYRVVDDPRRKPAARVTCREGFAGWRFAIHRRRRAKRIVAEWLIPAFGPTALTLRSGAGVFARVEFPRGPDGSFRRAIATPNVVTGPVFAETHATAAWEDRWGRRMLAERLRVRCYDVPNWLALVEVEAAFAATTGNAEFDRTWRWQSYDDLRWTGINGARDGDLGAEPTPGVVGACPRGEVVMLAHPAESVAPPTWKTERRELTIHPKPAETLLLGRKDAFAMRLAISDRSGTAAHDHWYTDYRWPPTATFE